MSRSNPYPEIDVVLDNLIVSFSGMDWDFYNIRGLIKEMKETIPEEFRDYDELTKKWAIDPEYAHIMRDLIRKYFG